MQVLKCLEDDGCVSKKEIIKEMRHHSCRKPLMKMLSPLKEKTWIKELDMYPDVIDAIRDSFYKDTKDILVVDTHHHNNFCADVSIARYADDHLPYCIALENLSCQESQQLYHTKLSRA